jgi:hypothetical protein
VIARNYLRHPEALAAQLCLPFTAVLRWATKRPGSRLLRAIRAARAAAISQQYAAPAWFPPLCDQQRWVVPAWAAEAKKAARALSNATRKAIPALFTEDKGFIARVGRKGPPIWALLGFQYAA